MNDDNKYKCMENSFKKEFLPSLNLLGNTLDNLKDLGKGLENEQAPEQLQRQ